jgi:hypothetical protein
MQIPSRIKVFVALIAAIALCPVFMSFSEEPKVAVAYEYATVRFMEEQTSIVWPDGSVEKVVPTSGKKRPKEADYRMFWLTISMNIMGKKGFEFVYMDGPDVVMKRRLDR